jgi:hypothetical protein
LDVRSLITVDDVMEELKLGPNGSLIYCMEYIEKNLDWVLSSLAKLPKRYLIFDLPGQVLVSSYITIFFNNSSKSTRIC